MKYVRPSPNEEIVPASVTALKQYFGEDRVQVAHLSLTELSEAIKRGDVAVSYTHLTLPTICSV